MTYEINNKILDDLLEGFQLISFDWKYLYINESACQQGMSSKEELLGYTMMEKYPGIEKTELFRVMQKCMHERTTAKLENEFKQNDGSVGWFELRIEPVSEGLFILSLDITERKIAEKNLKQLNESLEEKVSKRTLELEEKNKEITDSIIYAKKIQDAKLPNIPDIRRFLDHIFVLYKPKSIVSGDFYFFQRTEDNIFIASVDCTGHGVPGAILSMLGHEKLTDAINNCSDISNMLNYLNKAIKKSLNQTNRNNPNRDGMDIALCCINTKTGILKFTGANRPLWLIRKGEEVIEEIKATRKAIGGFTEDEQHFDTHEIKVNKGDTFYIFTDGYTDTFGGEDDKKLKSKKFREILLSIQDKSMQEQERYLDDFIENWKNGIEQVDDILIIGVQL